MSLKSRVSNLPQSAGVYQYFDSSKRLLYIGKAKNLKKRVSSYFSIKPDFKPKKNLSPRVYKMISETKFLEYIVVDSEHDALILENSLIKQLKPKYNILLRDDKTYPYIFIDLNEEFPRFEITRKVIKGSKIRYFGPFSTSANEILETIYELFTLVQKRSCLRGKKSCLFYQIGRCLAPCEGKIDQKSYLKIVEDAISLIKDKNKMVKLLEDKMQEYSQKLLFEEASKIRDRVYKIKKADRVSYIDLAKVEDFDIFSISILDSRAVGVRVFIRDGKVTSSSHSFFRSSSGFDIDELYRRVLLEYYKDDIPYRVKNILIYEEFKERVLIEELLQKRYKKKIDIKVPKIGELKRLTTLAYKNGVELLKSESKKESTDILIELQTLLSLDKTPFEIEGYDNSHLMGEATVGAIIKWDNEFIKSGYRHYKLEAKDEYGQMRELIKRRVDSFSKNPPPDLMIIDGGETLLKLAIKIVKKSGLFVDVIAIAKEKRDARSVRSRANVADTIYTEDGAIKLSPNDRRLQFIQNIRDESHRFAISFFKKQKLKADQKISLLNKRGVGEATVRKLLQYFETFENINTASFEDIERVVGTKIAQSIKNI